MKTLQSSSANQASFLAATEGESRDLPLFSAAASHSEGSMWIIAVAGLLFAIAAANLLCLSPRWYSNRFISLVYEPARFVVVTGATGAAVVRILWGLLSKKPSASPTWIARNLSGGWVFLPCFVLLYEQNSPWMLLVVALVAVGIAFGMRRILPAAVDRNTSSDRPANVLRSLDGLPPSDSPLLLAFWIAIFLQAALLLAVGDTLVDASVPFSISVFLFAWRWTFSSSSSSPSPRAVEWWIGKHPPLRQAAAAIFLTALTLIPFSVEGSGGLYRLRHAGSRPTPASKRPSDADATSGYFGIILYPPPKKKEIVAPAPHTDSFLSGAITKPVLIPFDGPYWYLKSPNRQPSTRAHIAHGKPTEVNVRSTDSEPLRMEAHQKLGRSIDLACCREMDVAITNADTRPGEITLLALVSGSSPAGKFTQLLGQQSIQSSQPGLIPTDRAPVTEILRFPIPVSRALRSFDEITVIFMTARQRSRAGAKVAIDSFELIPKP